MTVLTEGRRAGEFLVSEANGHRSREVVTIASNGSTVVDLSAGTVLGQITANDKYGPFDHADTVTGVGTAIAVLYDNIEVPATGDIDAVIIARDAEVVAAELEYGSGADSVGGVADLAAVGIIAR